MILSTINFSDFLEPLRKSLFSFLPILGDPCSFVKALFIRVQMYCVSEKIVNPKDDKTFERGEGVGENQIKLEERY